MRVRGARIMEKGERRKEKKKTRCLTCLPLYSVLFTLYSLLVTHPTPCDT